MERPAKSATKTKLNEHIDWLETQRAVPLEPLMDAERDRKTIADLTEKLRMSGLHVKQLQRTIHGGQ